MVTTACIPSNNLTFILALIWAFSVDLITIFLVNKSSKLSRKCLTVLVFFFFCNWKFDSSLLVIVFYLLFTIVLENEMPTMQDWIWKLRKTKISLPCFHNVDPENYFFKKLFWKTKCNFSTKWCICCDEFKHQNFKKCKIFWSIIPTKRTSFLKTNRSMLTS